jgi:GNAT superfamily N-acetyltransferase
MPDEDFRPRRAGVEEAAQVGRLLHDFNTEFSTPSPGAEVLTDRLLDLLVDDRTLAIVAGHPAIAIGLVTLRPNVWYPGSVALLDELYVTPQLRNKGIGSAIIGYLEHHARSNGIAAIEINVDEGDVDARSFYERHGYSSIDPDSNERALYYFRPIAGGSEAKP